MALESADFGEFFVHYICMELKAWMDYRRPRSLLLLAIPGGAGGGFHPGWGGGLEVKATRRARSATRRVSGRSRRRANIRRFILVCGRTGRRCCPAGSGAPVAGVPRTPVVRRILEPG